MSLLGREYLTVPLTTAPRGPRTAAPAAHRGTGSTTRLAPRGRLDAAAAAELVHRCHRLDAAGHAQVVLDLSDVDDCDRAALDLLVLLVHRARTPAVRVEGARRPQFRSALEDAPLADLRRLCSVVDELAPTAAV